jgi:hypothetical protein
MAFGAREFGERRAVGSGIGSGIGSGNSGHSALRLLIGYNVNIAYIGVRPVDARDDGEREGSV